MFETPKYIPLIILLQITYFYKNNNNASVDKYLYTKCLPMGTV